MPLAEVLGAVEQPFPGLRPFEAEESLLFFGRDQHVEQLLRSLGGSRFLAVIGASGSGKSSLVRAGLLPALYRGYLAGSTTRWRIAVMRPGTAPLANLCGALGTVDALGPGDEARRRELLSSSSMGLVEAVEAAGLPAGESVLVVVDQFEELFRYRRQAYRNDGGAEAGLFVSLLLAAAEQFDAPIYIVLTMRSDFLGECTEFPGLAEALSRSQYLIPRLTREQRRQAIEKPLRLAGAGITTRSLQQVLNDWGDEATADPLPLLQHALARTFRQWKESGAQGDLDLADYQAAGGMEGALDAHAEAVHSSLDDAGKVRAEKILRALTATELGRRIRRPTRLDRLYKVVGAVTESQRDAVDAVLRKFLERSNALLVASSPGDLRPDTVLDIPHESLIAKWKRLEGWTRREAVSAEWYIDAANGAALFAKREGALWRDPTLARALGFAKSEGWNEHWAAQYRPDGNPGFVDVQSFLRRSRTAQQRQRVLWWAGAAVVLAALVVASVFYVREMRIAESNRVLRSEVAAVQAAKAAEDGKIQDFQKRLQELSSDKSLTAAQKAQREQELQAQLAISQAEAAKLKAQQDQTTKLLNDSKTNVAAVNSALQDQVTKLEARLDTAEKQRQDAANESTTLRRQLDAANQELTKLKSPPPDPLPKANEPPVVRQPPAPQKASEQPAARELLTVPAFNNFTNAVFSPDGRYFAGGSDANRAITIQDSETGKEVRVFRPDSPSNNLLGAIAFNPYGMWLASAAWSSAIVWNTETGAVQLKTSKHGTVQVVAFGGGGDLLATGGNEKTVTVWDVPSGKELRTLQVQQYFRFGVFGLAFGTNGNRLAIAGGDAPVQVWDSATAKRLLTLSGSHGDSVTFSPDGKRLATGDYDKAVKLWDATSGMQLLTLRGHQQPVRGVAFSPDSRRLASASDDTTAKLWDTETGQELTTLRHSSKLRSVAYSPDGRRLLTTSENDIKIWDVSVFAAAPVAVPLVAPPSNLNVVVK
jgi:hypothetical protein